MPKFPSILAWNRRSHWFKGCSSQTPTSTFEIHHAVDLDNVFQVSARPSACRPAMPRAERLFCWTGSQKPVPFLRYHECVDDERVSFLMPNREASRIPDSLCRILLVLVSRLHAIRPSSLARSPSLRVCRRSFSWLFVV